MTFLDLDLHVLKFNIRELCPLAKELIAILGFLPYCPTIVPTSSIPLFVQYFHLLSSSLEGASSIAIDKEIDFLSLIVHLRKSMPMHWRACIGIMLQHSTFYAPTYS